MLERNLTWLFLWMTASFFKPSILRYWKLCGHAHFWVYYEERSPVKYFVLSAVFSFLYYFMVSCFPQCYPVFVSLQVIFHLLRNCLYLPCLGIRSHKGYAFDFLSFAHLECPIHPHPTSSVIKCFCNNS